MTSQWYRKADGRLAPSILAQYESRTCRVRLRSWIVSTTSWGGLRNTNAPSRFGDGDSHTNGSHAQANRSTPTEAKEAKQGQVETAAAHSSPGLSVLSRGRVGIPGHGRMDSGCARPVYDSFFVATSQQRRRRERGGVNNKSNNNTDRSRSADDDSIMNNESSSMLVHGS
jgi:hypothetical protein